MHDEPMPLMPSQKVPDYAHIHSDVTDGYFWGLVALILFSPLWIDLPAFLAMFSGWSPALQVVFMSLQVAKFCLMAIWLAWGGSRVLWRMIVVGSSLLGTSVILARTFPWGGTVVPQLWWLTMLATATGIAVPRLLGVRWARIASERRPAALPEKPSRQFALLDMFLWTATAACVFGVFRWLPLPDEIVLYIYLGIGTLLFIVGSLGSMWAILGTNGPVLGRGTMVVAGMVFAGFVIAVLTGMSSESEVVGYWLAFNALSTFCVMFGLLVTRRFGYRLHWRETVD